MTKGVKDAPKAEIAQALVEKADEAKAGRGHPARRSRRRRKSQPRRRRRRRLSRETKPDPIAEKLKKQDQQKQERQGRAAAAAEEAAAATAAEIRRRQDRRVARQARVRNATPRPAPSSIGADARHRHRQCRQALAIGDRRAARAADGAVEPAGRHRRMPEEFVDHASASSFKQRRHVDRAAAVLTSGTGVLLQRGARQRGARGVPVGQPYDHAATRSLRHLEGYRIHLRHRATCFTASP